MSLKWTCSICSARLALLTHKLFLLTLRLLFRLSQLVSLTPLSYGTDHRFRTHSRLTCAAYMKCVCLAAGARIVFLLTTSLYGATNVQHTSLFTQIANLTMASDVIVSLVLFATQIMQRKRLASFLNAFQRLLQLLTKHAPTGRYLINWRILVLLWLKILFSAYELFSNVPFFMRVARQLGSMQLLAYVAHLYIQHLSSIYANSVIAIMLLLLACLQLLELNICDDKYLPQRELEHVLKLEFRLTAVIGNFMDCFQFGILLILFAYFLNILANLYAMLDYLVSSHGVPLTISNYVLLVTAQLYWIILSAQLCIRRHQRIRARLEEMIYAPKSIGNRLLISLDWPLECVNFPVMGMFLLDHGFWLFLVSYSVNFIVIILQFTIENLK